MENLLTSPWRAHTERLHARLALMELSSGEAWTWSRLALEVDHRRAQIRSLGLAPLSRIALLGGASNDWVAWVWACLEEGIVWCPLPPITATMRRQTQIEHCEPHAVVEDGGLRPMYPDSPLCPEGSAYLIYTSGSTGEPKGVLVGSAGLAPLWREQIAMFGTTQNSRAAWMLSPAFDASLSDVGVALTAGATLYIVPPGHWLRWSQWKRDMDTHQIDQVDAPPSWLSLWARKAPPASLRTIIAGGEPTPLAILRAWSGQVKWVNVYGPTEATVCTSAEVRSSGDPHLNMASIGIPFAHVKYKLAALDQHAGDTSEGELWIGGDAVAIGYWKNPSLTQDRFVQEGDTRWFKSGDHVELSQDRWIWKGRIDRQVKRNGKLLNLDEVEAVVQRMPGVHLACALIDAHDHLCVAVLNDAPSGENVKAWCALHLPPWGVPSRIIRVAEFPKTHSDKIDRAKVLSQGESL